MIFIEKKFACKKKVRYEFTYLDYLYYCDREAWEKVVNGEYPIRDEEDDDLCVKEESTEYFTENEKQAIKTGDKKHDKRAARIEGVLDAVRQIVERMIKMNLKDDFIKQATGAKKSEIEKIRKEINKI